MAVCLYTRFACPAHRWWLPCAAISAVCMDCSWVSAYFIRQVLLPGLWLVQLGLTCWLGLQLCTTYIVLFDVVTLVEQMLLP